MTRIKYRALSTNNKDWIYGYPLLYGFENWIADFGGVKRNIKPKTVGQFTGLKDQQGNEVYEGDIIRMLEVSNNDEKTYTTDIRWDEGAFVMKSGKEDYDTFLGAWFGDPMNTYPLFEIEVIGNVHDNPELLEVNES